jgi:hypothetical protein
MCTGGSVSVVVGLAHVAKLLRISSLSGAMEYILSLILAHGRGQRLSRNRRVFIILTRDSGRSPLKQRMTN